jgi:hypothetical protein
MSWSLDTGIVAKKDAVGAIMRLNPSHEIDPATEDQIYHAKKTALELVRGISGPFVSITMSGHANGVGWQGKEGYANDCINLSVTQHLVEKYD